MQTSKMGYVKATYEQLDDLYWNAPCHLFNNGDAPEVIIEVEAYVENADAGAVLWLDPYIAEAKDSGVDFLFISK